MQFDSSTSASLTLSSGEASAKSPGLESGDLPIDSPIDSHQTTRILLVDDDIVDRKSIRNILNSRPQAYDIDEATSQDEAFKLCETSDYDCILLDFKLGKGDALDMLPKFKELSADGRVAVVLVTGMGNERIAAQAFKAGVHDYVAKLNLSGDVLFAALEHAIRKIRLERENEKQREALEFLSLHDHLTGMPNRKLFNDRLEQAVLHAQRSGVPFSVCSMDLDRFKLINDTYGHDVGDQVLVTIANRMTSVVRSSDTIARFGGDEFVALLDIPDIQGAVAVAKKLIASVFEPMTIEGIELDVGLSIGITTFSGNCQEALALLKKADEAMYDAKISNQDIVVFSGDDQSKDQRVMEIATQISSIAESDTLIIEYQPKINLATNQVVGAEALVRWRHPSLGLLPPVEFIPMVERTQEIKPMTFYIIEQVIKQCVQWRDSGYDIPVSVNVSASMLDAIELPDVIEFQLKKWNLPAHLLTLEVTEIRGLSGLNVSRSVLQQLAQLGVQLSIDDFGSGHGSFRYLRDYTIHEIKIGSVFVDDLIKGLRDESIIKSMLELGKGFDVTVVAGGIRSLETLQKLKSLGCQYGQGFYFSKSLSASDLIEWVEQWHTRHEPAALSQ